MPGKRSGILGKLSGMFGKRSRILRKHSENLITVGHSWFDHLVPRLRLINRFFDNLIGYNFCANYMCLGMRASALHF